MRIDRNTLVVRPGDNRPAGKPDECFYCRQPMGSLHLGQCPIPSKKVKVRVTIEYDIEVPIFWDKDNIEFARNESSWCASNLIQELEELEKTTGCLCPVAVYELIEGEGT